MHNLSCLLQTWHRHRLFYINLTKQNILKKEGIYVSCVFFVLAESANLPSVKVSLTQTHKYFINSSITQSELWCLSISSVCLYYVIYNHLEKKIHKTLAIWTKSYLYILAPINMTKGYMYITTMLLSCPGWVHVLYF